MKNQKQLLAALILILVAVFSRMIPHPANLTAIGAAGLFGGAVIQNRKLAFIIPFLSLFISDLFIGVYPTMWVTYLGFAMFVLIGMMLNGKTNAITILSGSVAGTILFFLITNLPIFYTNLQLYPVSWEGTMESYRQALPFLRNQLVGEAIYSAALFSIYELSKPLLMRRTVKA